MVLAGEAVRSMRPRRPRSGAGPHRRSTSRRSAAARSGHGSSRSALCSRSSSRAGSSTTRSSARSRARRRSPCRTSSGSRRRSRSRTSGRGARPAGSPRRQLGRRGRRRLRAEPDRGHARRQGDGRPHRRVVRQARGDDPERRRPDGRGRRRRAHPSRARRAGRRGQLRPGRGHRHRAVAGRRHRRRRRDAGPDQRLEGPEARHPSRTSSASRTTRRPRSSSAPASACSRIDEDSDQAAGIVTGQTPSGGSEGSKGSTVTVTVSKGPSTSAVPDVTTQDVAIAQTTLEAAGFRTRVVLEDTDDPTLRRHRHLAGSRRRHAGQAEHARHALRRTLRRANDQTTTTP